MKPFSKALLVALCLGTGGIAGADADVAPPPTRDEGTPAPRDGYVWASGYWEWSGHAYTWVPGHFIYAHRGSHWVADRWDQVGAQWKHVKGHWEH